MVSASPQTPERLRRAVSLLKGLLWLLVPPALAALCLRNWLVGPAALLAALGLALHLRRLGPLSGWRWQRPLLVLCIVELVLLGAALWLLGRSPRGGWQRLPQTCAWSDPSLLLTGDGVLVVVTSSPKNSFWSEDGGRSFRAHGLPGPFAFALADDAQRGWVWVGAAQGETVSMYDRGKRRWLQMPRPPGHVWALALSEDRVFLALGLSGLAAASDAARTFQPVPGVTHCTGVAVAPDDEQRLLAVGRAWFSSGDGGRHWSRLASPLEERFAHPEVALGGGGWSYVYEGGMLSGALAVSGPGQQRFELRRLPATDVRVMIADAEDGRRVWLGSWGQGVFSSEDGGRHWRDLGLQSVEVRSLAIDPRHGRLFAGSSNLALRRGVYVRSLPPPGR